MNYKKLGLAIAFSPRLEAMLHEAARLKRLWQAELILIHVGETTPDVTTTLTELLHRAGLSPNEVTVRWESGKPQKKILAVCQEEKIDLLIAGALKKENVVNHYIGTIARDIMHRAECSVLMIIEPSVHEPALKNIVVNAEDSPYITQAITAACRWAVTHQAWVHVVRELKLLGLALAANDECNEKEYDQRKQEMLQQEIDAVKKMMENIPHTPDKVNVKMISGKSGFELVRFAKRKEADLLVMGAPHRRFSFFTKLFPHDQEYIFNDLPCNLLIVKPHD
jgi:nucleotide-binding universal stress UspA family protein